MRRKARRYLKAAIQLMKNKNYKDAYKEAFRAYQAAIPDRALENQAMTVFSAAVDHVSLQPWEDRRHSEDA